MENKKIISVFKKTSKNIVLYQDEQHGGQWIANKFVIYPFDNVPYFTADRLKKTFDLDDKWSVQIKKDKPDFPELHENQMPFDETELQKLQITINGLMVFREQETGEIYFMDPCYLKPLNVSDDYITYYLRQIEGTNVIAVKNGLLLDAAVLAIPTRTLDAKITEAIKSIATGIIADENRRAVENEKIEKGYQTDINIFKTED